MGFRREILFERPRGNSIVTLGADGAFALFLKRCGGTKALTYSWMLRGEVVERAEKIEASWSKNLQALA